MNILRKLLPLVILLMLISCHREVEMPVTYLSVQPPDRGEPVEWMEVTGSRKNGMVSIEAAGYLDERFHIRVVDTPGTLHGVQLTPANIHYADGSGFSPHLINGGYLDIQYINPQIIRGDFDINYMDSAGGIHSYRITGKFQIQTP